MAEQVIVYHEGERFITASPDGEAHIYEVAWDGRPYVIGYMPEKPDDDYCPGPLAKAVMDRIVDEGGM